MHVTEVPVVALGVSFRTWVATGLFSGGLVALLAATLAVMGWWARRERQVSGDDARTVAHNTSIPFVLLLLNRAIDFAFVALLYRFVAPETLGAYDFAAIVVTLYLMTLAEWGMNALTMRDIAVRRDEAEQIMRSVLRLRLRLALLALPLAALIVLAYAGLAALHIVEHGLSRETQMIIGLLSLTLFPSAFSGTVTALFQAFERHEVPAVLNLLTNIGSALLRVGALALGWGVVGVAGGALGGSLISGMLFFVALRRAFPNLRLRGSHGALRPLLSEGWPLLVNSLLINVFFRFDTLIIQAFQGAAALATYNVAYKYVNLTQIIPPVVVNAIFPLLSRRAVNDRAGMLRAYGGTLRMLMLIAFPVAMGMAVLAGPLVGGLSGAEYLPGGAWALAITIWYLPGSYINGLAQYVVVALGRQRVITKAFVITAVFNLLLNLALVPLFGYLAAAAITIASEAVLFWPLYRVLKAEGVAPQLLPLLLRPALAALAMGAAMWLALQVHLVLAVLVALPVYGGTLWLLGTFTAEDRQLLTRVLGRA